MHSVRSVEVAPSVRHLEEALPLEAAVRSKAEIKPIRKEEGKRGGQEERKQLKRKRQRRTDKRKWNGRGKDDRKGKRKPMAKELGKQAEGPY